LHHEVYEGKELLQFTEFVGFLRFLENVKPTFSDIIEARFYDFFKTEHPAGFSCSELNSTDAAILMLFKLLNTHSFAQLNVENAVVFHDIVAVLANLNHSLYNFISDE